MRYTQHLTAGLDKLMSLQLQERDIATAAHEARSFALPFGQSPDDSGRHLSTPDQCNSVDPSIWYNIPASVSEVVLSQAPVH